MAAMQDALVTYFTGEKRAGVFFLVLALAALAAAVALWRGAGPFRGAALPLAAVALGQLAVGGTLVARTDRQMAALAAQLESDPRAFQADETARMDRIMTSFRWIVAVEVVLLCAAVALLLSFHAPSLAAGIGLGLLLQASATLAFDVVAVHRNRTYQDAVRMLGHRGGN
jgi:hypothetical protein